MAPLARSIAVVLLHSTRVPMLQVRRMALLAGTPVGYVQAQQVATWYTHPSTAPLSNEAALRQ